MMAHRRVTDMGSFGEAQRSLAEAIRETRMRLNVTQAVLEETTGIAQADISRVENGTANPTLRSLHRIAEGLGCQLAISFIHTS